MLLRGTTPAQVGDVAATVLGDPDVLRCGDVAAMLADCAARPERYVHAIAFSWGCCHDSRVNDVEDARVAFETFVQRLREAGLVGLNDSAHLALD